MLDFIKHLLGLCGDGHPSLLFGLGLVPVLFNLKARVILYVKILLRRFGLNFHRDKIQS